MPEKNVENVNVKTGGTYSYQDTTMSSKAQGLCAECITLHFAHTAYVRENLLSFFSVVVPCMMIQMYQHF